MKVFMNRVIAVFAVLFYGTLGLGIMFKAAANDPSLDLRNPGVVLIVANLGLLTSMYLALFGMFIGIGVVRVYEAAVSILRALYEFIQTHRKNS
jgi:hypothetical protein